jgi:hypothetical protein
VRHFAIMPALACLGLLLLTGEAAADKPAKNAVVFDGDVQETQGFVSDLATLTLRRFRRKRILRVDVTLKVEAFTGGDLALLNGVSVNGTSIPFDSKSCNTSGCSVSSSTFVDLDELAAANPDDFKKQPLVVTIHGRLEGNPPILERRLRALVQVIRK